MTGELLFVYGTLRRGVCANRFRHLMRGCVYQTKGSLQGRLYEVAGYPGAVATERPRDRVQGELYRIIDDQALIRLDAYEACSGGFPEPHEFVRRRLPVTLESGRKVLAWVYLFNHDTAGLRQIRSGDYRTHRYAVKRRRTFFADRNR
jgi:gamma-glutamylcyclotransferase (GGCT)/AIG2-like uncharacterized protein YtfP